jgi:hypothetical protein
MGDIRELSTFTAPSYKKETYYNQNTIHTRNKENIDNTIVKIVNFAG